jgi:hypothetical protein
MPAGDECGGGAGGGESAGEADQAAGCDDSGDGGGGGANAGDAECEGFSGGDGWGEGAVPGLGMWLVEEGESAVPAAPALGPSARLFVARLKPCRSGSELMVRMGAGWKTAVRAQDKEVLWGTGQSVAKFNSRKNSKSLMHRTPTEAQTSGTFRFARCLLGAETSLVTTVKSGGEARA